MTSRPFVHLHCHSHYSLLDGASPIDKLVKRAKDHGMNALAITDHGNLHGALEFYNKAKGKGINPILGYEAYIAPGSRFEKKDAANSKEASYHLTLLAQNRTGFKNLIKLASMAMLEGFYYKPRIDKEILAAHSEGLICLSGCVSSEFSSAILGGSHTLPPSAARRRSASGAGGRATYDANSACCAGVLASCAYHCARSARRSSSLRSPRASGHICRAA